MFGKKKKIKKYLEKKHESSYTPFDYVLRDYLSKELKGKLKELGLSKIEIHVDWFEKYECVGIQAIDELYVSIHIYPDELGIACDIDEADEEIPISYDNAQGDDWIYNQIQEFVRNAKKELS